MIEDRIRIQNYLENHFEVNKEDFIKEKCKVTVLVGVISCRKIRLNWVHCSAAESQ